MIRFVSGDPFPGDNVLLASKILLEQLALSVQPISKKDKANYQDQTESGSHGLHDFDIVIVIIVEDVFNGELACLKSIC